jgi:predicted GNAT family acetyltransferase
MKNQELDDFVKSKMESLKHSKSYYIKQNNKCVSTVSTVADTTKSAMVVAVATDPEYRGKGYASTLMIKLLHEYLVNRKKSLCLFFDNPSAGAIYHRLGFKDIDQWVMLVRK